MIHSYGMGIRDGHRQTNERQRERDFGKYAPCLTVIQMTYRGKAFTNVFQPPPPPPLILSILLSLSLSLLCSSSPASASRLKSFFSFLFFSFSLPLPQNKTRFPRLRGNLFSANSGYSWEAAYFAKGARMSEHGPVRRLIAIIRRTSSPASRARFIPPYYHVASAAAGR